MTDTVTSPSADADASADADTSTDAESRRSVADGPPRTGVHGRAVRTRVPGDETPAARCHYCDRPFRSERLRDLHVGEVHAAEHTDAEREAHEAADEAELDELFFYHIKVVVVIGLLFSAFVLGYTVVLSMGA